MRWKWFIIAEVIILLMVAGQSNFGDAFVMLWVMTIANFLMTSYEFNE